MKAHFLVVEMRYNNNAQTQIIPITLQPDGN